MRWGGRPMFLGIQRIDMKITDERVLSFLSRPENVGCPISSSYIADNLGCHKNTVQIALKRIERSGKIRKRRNKRGQSYIIELLV